MGAREGGLEKNVEYGEAIPVSERCELYLPVIHGQQKHLLKTNRNLPVAQAQNPPRSTISDHAAPLLVSSRTSAHRSLEARTFLASRLYSWTKTDRSFTSSVSLRSPSSPLLDVHVLLLRICRPWPPARKLRSERPPPANPVAEVAPGPGFIEVELLDGAMRRVASETV